MAFTAFPSRKPTAANDLPLTLISLTDWTVSTLEGADAEKYLQGQVTADVTTLDTHHHVLCAHCDPKGKMWSNLRLFKQEDNHFAFVLRRSVQENQLAELKKYAVFSKVTINIDKNSVLLGLAGVGARAALSSVFQDLPTEQMPMTVEDGTAILWFAHPTERFMIKIAAEKVQSLIEAIGDKVQLADSQQWLSLDIEAGIPIIDSASSGEFLPQATNLQALNGISFKKGCYTGQEMVARAKFRGANKRALWLVSGTASRVPDVGEGLELQLDDKWRRTGSVLAAIQLDDNRVNIQIVMNNDLPLDSVFRVTGDENSQLTIVSLPYRLDDE